MAAISRLAAGFATSSGRVRNRRRSAASRASSATAPPSVRRRMALEAPLLQQRLNSLAKRTPVVLESPWTHRPAVIGSAAGRKAQRRQQDDATTDRENRRITVFSIAGPFSGEPQATGTSPPTPSSIPKSTTGANRRTGSGGTPFAKRWAWFVGVPPSGGRMCMDSIPTARRYSNRRARTDRVARPEQREGRGDDGRPAVARRRGRETGRNGIRPQRPIARLATYPVHILRRAHDAHAEFDVAAGSPPSRIVMPAAVHRGTAHRHVGVIDHPPGRVRRPVWAYPAMPRRRVRHRVRRRRLLPTAAVPAAVRHAGTRRRRRPVRGPGPVRLVVADDRRCHDDHRARRP